MAALAPDRPARPPDRRDPTGFDWRRAGVIALLYALLLLFALISIGPFLWLVSTSLKSGQSIFAFPPQLLPDPPNLGAYRTIWTNQDIPRLIWNTTAITFWGVLANVLLATTSGYALARIRFPGRDIVFFLIVSTLVLPNTLGIVVNFITIVGMSLVDTLAGVVLPNAINVINVFLMRQAFLSIPTELEDSGRIDGASEFGIWWRIMLPLVRPAMATVIIFEFVAFWNIYLWPLIVVQDPEKYPLAVAIAKLTTGELSLNFANTAAATVISMVPTILIFLLLQRYFIEGLAGSVKG